MSNRFKVFTGRSSKDTEERLAEVSLSKRGGLADPYQDKPQPTGRDTEGQSPQFSRFDHSHPTAILAEADPQLPVSNEIRFNTADKLVRWDETTQNWVPLSVEVASNLSPLPVGGNPSAGVAVEFSRADHRHRIVLEPDGSLTSPTDRQLGVWTALDGIGNLCLAIYHQNQNRWELPFGRPLLSQTTAVPSGKGFHTTVRTELAFRTDTNKQGILYFRRSGATTWETVGTVVQTSDQTLGITGELLRTSATITPSGQWYLRGTDNGGNVRALPLSIRTYNQSNKPTTNLPLNTDDAYGFFIQDRRLIELYPQQSGGIEFPVILTGFQTTFPLRPAQLLSLGANTIQETTLETMPAWEFIGSTANTNIPSLTTQGIFLPMGIRRVRFSFLFRNPSSNNHTFRFGIQLVGFTNTSFSNLALLTEMSIPINASTTTHFISDPVSISVPATHSAIGGTPCFLFLYRRWDLEATNNNPLILGIVGLVAVRE